MLEPILLPLSRLYRNKAGDMNIFFDSLRIPKKWLVENINGRDGWNN